MEDNVFLTPYLKIFEEKLQKISASSLSVSDKCYYMGAAYLESFPKNIRFSSREPLKFSWTDAVEEISNYLPEIKTEFASVETFRKFVSRRKIRLAEVQKVEASVTPPKDFDPEHFQKVTQLRDYWNAIRLEQRAISRLDELKNIIVVAADKINKLPAVPYVNRPVVGSAGDKEAILMLSDLHVGVDYNSYNNVYNQEVAAKRLGLLAKNIINYCDTMEVGALNIVNLGDMIHGIIHTNARIKSEYDAVTQTMVAANLLTQFLNVLLSQLHPGTTITYRGCVDNHSRLSPNKNEAIDEENLSRIIDWYLEVKMKEYTGKNTLVFPKDNLDVTLGKFKLKNGKLVMFAHGHEDPINSAMQNMIGASREFVDYILLGHYHEAKQKTYQRCTVLVNGSIVGIDDYANANRLFSDPSQKLLVFNNNDLIDIDIRLN